MKISFWLCLAIWMSAAGCTSSRITTSWKAKNIQSKKYGKILVLGIVNEPDRTIRERMEEHIAGDLNARGYTAVCSCEEFNPKTFENMTEKQAIDKLTGSGIDGILTVVLLNKTKEKLFISTAVQNPPPGMQHHGEYFWGYYRNTYERIYSPGYYIEATRYYWETNFYELQNKQLLYSAQSQSFDPSTTVSMAHEYGKMIVQHLLKQDVLKQ